MPILNTCYQALYQCPVVQLGGYARRFELPGTPLAYLDFGGATGTSKDGLAAGMLALAAQRGDLKPGQPVVEASSGIFAAALTLAARTTGHPVFLCVPISLPEPRKTFLASLGAELMFSSGIHGHEGAVRLAQETAGREGGYFVNYFANDDNPEYHRRFTGPRILQETGAQVDAIIVGVGSGGTITGVGEHVKAWHNEIRIVAVEPYESQAIGGGFIGRHDIPGLGVGFVPENYNPYVVDTLMAVPSAEAQKAARDVLRSDGVPADASAGAVLYAARQLLEKGHVKRPLCVFCGRMSCLL